jgi:hypothetical protein
MEQRIYHGNVSPEGLADYLVQYYGAQEHLRAQKLGQGDSLVVQIGHPHDNEIRNAVTLGIHRTPENSTDLIVTMGEQQWITPQLAGYAAMMGLVSVLITPWALFALIWPVSQLLGSRVLPGEIWNAVQTYAMSQGAVPGTAQTLTHPHLGSTAPPADPTYPLSPAATQAFEQPAPAAPAEDAKTQKLDQARLS